MRRSSGTTVGVALALAVALGASTSAHRRDEYLQAARIAVEPDHVAIDLDLTPGAAVAEAVIAGIDTERDGTLSAAEQNAYARRVLASVSITVDGRPLPLDLASTAFPDLSAARRGEGAVRLQLRTVPPAVAPGAHELTFANAHLPEHSVYLANALVPDSARVSITAQRRTADQSTLTIVYTLGAAPRGAARTPLIVTLAFAVALMVPLTRRMRSRPGSSAGDGRWPRPAS